MQSHIEPMTFAQPMTFSVTRDELAQINRESREQHFSFVLSDDEIAAIPPNAQIEVLFPWLHTNYKGDQDVRLTVRYGEWERVLDVSLESWAQICQNGQPEPERRPWILQPS
jgi:hypothetical protein